MQTSTLLLTGALVGASLSPAFAQETTAAGNLNTEASWSALRNLVDASNNQSKIANITANSALEKANKIEACGKDGMIYSPTKGCVTPSIKVNYSKCSFTKLAAKKPNIAGTELGMSLNTKLMAEVYCPSNYVLVGINYRTVDGGVCCSLSNK